jgi:3-hydroxymyristoyl/3-hydroxydecanoyl-(acyl carrier protein) dehydratase
LPGEVLVLRATSDKSFSGLFRFNVEATVGRNLIASGALTLALVEGQTSATSAQPGAAT